MLYLVEKAMESGEVVEMIYMDQHGMVTKRRVKIYQVHHNYFRGYCYLRKSIRLFSIQNVLAIFPVLTKERMVI